MSRVMVEGKYEAGEYVLRFAKTDGERYGQIYMVIKPNMVLGVGNSIGGYFARQITYAGQKMFALLRVGGSLKSLPPDQINRRLRGQKGLVLKPGMLGLWATSSGSARRGLFHRYQETSDPIIAALREMEMPSNLLTEVERIEMEVSRGGDLCKHSTTDGDSFSFFRTDGTAEILEEGERVKTHHNQHHVGCMCSPDRVRISGGTWVVEAEEEKVMNGGIYPFIVRVTVTKTADRDLVAGKIREIMKCTP